MRLFIKSIGLSLLGVLLTQILSAHAYPTRWVDATDQQGQLFADPVAACHQQFQTFAEDAGSVFLGVSKVEGTSAHCEWTNYHDGNGPLVPLPSLAFVECEYGSRRISEDGAICTTSYVSNDRCEAQVGNPIDLKTGGKVQRRVDFESPDGRFRISRVYANKGVLLAGHGLGFSALGGHWRFEDDVSLRAQDFFGSDYWDADVNHGGVKGQRFENHRDVAVGAPIGPDIISYYQSPGATDYSTRLSLDSLVGGSAWYGSYNISTWTYTDPDGRVITFRSFPGTYDGAHYGARPIKIVWQDGYEQTRSYASDGRILRIEDNLGRYADFTWSLYQPSTVQQTSNGGLQVFPITENGVPVPLRGRRVSFITLYDGSIIDYNFADTAVSAWNSYGVPSILVDELKPVGPLIEMVRIANPSVSDDEVLGSVIDRESYEYDDLNSQLLTGIIDASGVKYLSVEYNDRNRAILSEHPGGADRVTASYNFIDVDNFEVTATNALNRSSTYKFEKYRSYDEFRVASIEGEAAFGCEADTQRFTNYSDDFGVTRKVDREGRVTAFAYDSRGQRTIEVRAQGTSEQVRTETDWHSTYPGLPTEIRRPGETMQFTYSGTRLASLRRIDTSGSGANDRVTTFGYGSHPFLPTSIDGPLPGSADTTTLTYAGNNLTSMTDSLGHSTTYSNYKILRSSRSVN